MVKPRDPAGLDRVDLLIFLDNNKAQKKKQTKNCHPNITHKELQFHNIIQTIVEWTLFSPEERRHLFDLCQTGPDTHLL